MAREILPKKITLNKEVVQWANISALTYGFSTNNKELISRSMNDIIVEPVRSKIITGFDKIKKYALKIEDHYKIYKYCKKKNIKYLCTPFSWKAAQELNKINVKFSC